MNQIIVSILASTIISIIASRFYYERPIVIPAIRYWGNIPILRIKNYGLSSLLNVHIVIWKDKNLFLKEQLNAIEPEYEKVWVFENGIQQYKKITVFIWGFGIFPKLFFFDTKKEINMSLLDDTVKSNDKNFAQ